MNVENVRVESSPAELLCIRLKRRRFFFFFSNVIFFLFLFEIAQLFCLFLIRLDNFTHNLCFARAKFVYFGKAITWRRL